MISGVTGFIGGELLRYIQKVSPRSQVYLIIRSRNGMSPQQRLEALVAEWQRFFVVPADVLANVQVIDGDLFSIRSLPVDKVDLFFHAAADTDMGMPLAASRTANVIATQKALALARGLKSLGRFVHFSTAFVAGKNRGVIQDDDRGKYFNNWYEYTKLEAEYCVQASDLPYLILRPSIVVGDSRNGYVRRLKVLYTVWRAWLTGQVPRAPIRRHALVDCVPIDYVVQASWALANKPECHNQIVQLCAGRGALDPVEALYQAAEVFGKKPGKLVPPWIARFVASDFGRMFTTHEVRQILDMFSVHLPYLGSRNRVFSDDKVRNLLASSQLICPPAQSYCRTLLQFCKDTQWAKKGKMLEE